VARKPLRFAFIEFEDQRDADDAIRALNGTSKGCGFWQIFKKILDFSFHASVGLQNPNRIFDAPKYCNCHGTDGKSLLSNLRGSAFQVCMI
jgi:RNA recognition motif-containing protein